MAAKVCPICRINKSSSGIVCKECKVEAQKNGFSVRRGYLAYGQNETYKIRFENVKKKVFVLWEEMRDEIDIFGDGEPQDVSWKDERSCKMIKFGKSLMKDGFYPIAIDGEFFAFPREIQKSQDWRMLMPPTTTWDEDDNERSGKRSPIKGFHLAVMHALALKDAGLLDEILKKGAEISNIELFNEIVNTEEEEA